jgi:hypothetical protein
VSDLKIGPLLLLVASLVGCQTQNRANIDFRGLVSRCALHHDGMRSVGVPLIIGCALPRSGELEARDRAYPNAYPRGVESKTDFCIIYVCDVCAQVQRDWERRHY